MAAATGKSECVTCGKEKSAVRCEGCFKIFCRTHYTDHCQGLSVQLDEIQVRHDLFRQTLTEQTTDPHKHPFMKQIDEWEKDSIKIIQQTADECRQLLVQHTTKHINQMEVNLAKLTDQLKQIRQENDFNEIDLRHLKENLTQLTEELDKPANISIQQDFGSFINKMSVVVSQGEQITQIRVNTKRRTRILVES
jgi:hypothetical protein